MGLADLFSSFVSTVYADAPEEKEEQAAPAEEPAEEPAAAAEEEEEEPEDPLPEMQEECKSSKCAAATAAFARCEEKVNAGKGYHGETCIEEFMMHCVDNCVAPQLFTKLK